jgi:cysteine-S-conjugate beta-lyase
VGKIALVREVKERRPGRGARVRSHRTHVRLARERAQDAASAYPTVAKKICPARGQRGKFGFEPMSPIAPRISLTSSARNPSSRDPPIIRGLQAPVSLDIVSEHPFDVVTEAHLRTRQSAKWRAFPEDVLPAWVAEMDYPIAEPIKRALARAIDLDDAGYADPRGLGGSFAPWAHARWGWDVRPTDVMVAPDVVTALTELLLVTTREGDGVVIEPPVYFPFASTIRRLHRTIVETPIVRDERGLFRLDLDAVERAYAGGARVHILCSPHNPTGRVHARAELERIAELAAKHDVLVLSDEIHAPMTHPSYEHVPLPCVSEDARRTSIVLTSASKSWNLAGLKASVMVACDDATRAVLARLPADMPYHAGHLGVLASRVAFAEAADWLVSTMTILDRNRLLLVDLLREHLPHARYVPPQAGYLAWIDCRELGIEGDPTKAFFERGRVALSSGPMFGTGGVGFARLNIATTKTLLEEAVRRMARAL